MNNTDRVPNPGVLGDQREQIRHNQLYAIRYQVTGLTGEPHGVLLKPKRITSLGAWGASPKREFEGASLSVSSQLPSLK